ncbi:MAG TPA: glycosyltransferase [Terracidiphilus sp.]|nr:glycosyltransferase [Terracidiphilus sp.]
MTHMRKTRVLYVNHTGQLSGAEYVLLNVLRGLDHSRYEPWVLCPAEGGLAEAAWEEGALWLPLPPLQARFTLRPRAILRSLAQVWRVMRSVRRYVKNLGPDFIHANTIRAGIVATLGAAGLRKVVLWHVHDSLPRHPLSSIIRLLAWSSRRTRIIAVSHATAREFCGRLPLQCKVRTIHNGVDLARFPHKRAAISTFRKKMSIPDDCFVVCSVGQICARKGIKELIDALATIRLRAPSLHLVIVGKAVFAHEQEYRNSLLQAVRDADLAGRVHFTGELKDVAPALQASDLLVLNSREEPFGLVLIEAMSCGTPVLATRVGGVPEIVTDGANGWLIEPGDSAALSGKLLELSGADSARRQVADFAHRTTSPQFSFERFHRDLRRLYLEMESSLQPKSVLRAKPAIAGYGSR